MNFTGTTDPAPPTAGTPDVTEVPVVSAEAADWSRERRARFEWAPSRSLLASIRDYQRLLKSRGVCAWGLRRVAVLRHRWWSAITGADIPLNCKLGGGLLLPHPNGIVIHPDANIGVNCLIFQQVTVGIRDASGHPEIGGHVDIGAGAKVLGRVKIGSHARIGANAVVIKDVTVSAVAVGVSD